jgi:hypothetical protein
MAVTTTNVSVSRTGTGWTVDVTACNLSINVAEKDIQVFHNGVAANVGDYTKTTPTLLTYNGAALGAITVVEIHRFTDVGPLTIVGYADRLSSNGYNSELDRLHRIIAEGRLNGIGGLAAITVTLDNAAYSYGVWSLDTVKGATRQAVANQFLATDNSIALKAPFASPVFTGTPTAPSPPAADATLKIANTGWAQAEFLSKLGGTVTGTTDFQGSTTAITRAANDNTTKLATTAYCDVNFADLADPQTITGAKTFSATSTFNGPAVFAGTTTAPTKTVDNNTTEVATTAYVVGQAASVAPLVNGTANVGTSLRYARQDHVHPTDTTRAATASPTFTGVPLSPTAAVDTNTTQIATTAYVVGQGYAKLAGPTLTGVPAAPTAAIDTNTTQLATTAYVVGQASSVAPLRGANASAVGTSLRYARQDHVHLNNALTVAGATRSSSAVVANTRIVFVENYDLGNNFDDPNDVYIAPFTGVCEVHFNAFANANIGLKLEVNSVATGVVRALTTSVWSSGHFYISVNAGDTIGLQSDTACTLQVAMVEFAMVG